MIWFNIKQLEQNLKGGTVSDKEAFTYLLTSSILLTISQYLGDDEVPNELMMWVELVLGVIFTIITLKATFDINTKGDNHDYLKRYTCLSLVAIIRLIAFAIPVAFASLLTSHIFKLLNVANPERLEYIFDLGISIGLGIAYYFILTNSFKRVSQA